jgi:thiamine biosynthesis protein ThiS
LEELSVEIVVNDHKHEVPDGITVAELLERLKLSKSFVAVEVNLQVVPHQQYGEYRLRPGDRLEIVTLVGGG